MQEENRKQEENERTQEENVQMSEVTTLGNIFFKPGRTFESLCGKPYFILGTIVLCVLSFVFSVSFAHKLGEEGYRRYFIRVSEENQRFSALSTEEKQQVIESQVKITRLLSYFSPVFLLIYLAIGGFIIWLVAKSMGSDVAYVQSFCLWLYSSFPPSVVFTIANLIVLFFKPQSEISFADQQRGLVVANLSFLIGRDNPALATLVASFDLFILWGWILFTIGLQKMVKLSSASAWMITSILFLVSSFLKVIVAALF